jgi:hypothetical protein
LEGNEAQILGHPAHTRIIIMCAVMASAATDILCDVCVLSFNVISAYWSEKFFKQKL